MVNNNWFETWFDSKEYHLLYGDRDETEAQIFIENVVNQLNVSPNSLCIDLACGKGRHTKTLGQIGMQAIGLDLSPQSILFAQNQNWTNTSFEVHDMRQPIPTINADMILNLFTSFGYFNSIEEDKAVLQNVNLALKPGAYFVQDYLNTYPIINELPQKLSLVKEGVEFKIHKFLESNCIKKNIQFCKNSEEYNFTESVKNYTAQELQDLHIAAGFEIVQLAGNYDLNNFDLNKSPRVIIISKKIN